MEPLEPRVLLAVTAVRNGSLLDVDLSGTNEFATIVHNTDRYEISRSGGAPIVVSDAGITGFDIDGDGSAGQRATLGAAPTRLAGDVNVDDVVFVDIAGNYRISGSVSIGLSSWPGAITESSGSLIVDGVTTASAGLASDIVLVAAANDFSTVTITSANNARLLDANSVTLGTVKVASSLEVSAGQVTTTADRDIEGENVTITLGADGLLSVDTDTSILAGNNVTLTADEMDLNASAGDSIRAAAGKLVLRAAEKGTQLKIGTAADVRGSGPAGTLGLDAADVSALEGCHGLDELKLPPHVTCPPRKPSEAALRESPVLSPAQIAIGLACSPQPGKD